MANRVQVRDLPKPEQIQSQPIKGDTFTGTWAPPDVSHKYNMLSKGLSVFGGLAKAGINMAAQAHAEHEKAAKEEALRAYQVWRSSTTNVEQVEAIRNGTVPFYTDPYINSVVKRDYGAMEAQALAREIQEERNGNKVPFHATDFNVERYLLQKAAPYVKRLQKDTEAITSFRKGLDQLRRSLKNEHAEMRGKAFRQHTKDITYRNFDAIIEDGVANNRDPEEIMTAIRKLYRSQGPRQEGGSLGLRYGEMDEVLLDILEEKSKDPRYANYIGALLRQKREDPNGMHIGSLADNSRHRKQVQRIQKQAHDAVINHHKELGIAKYRAKMVDAIQRKDGSHNMPDLKEPIHSKDEKGNIRIHGYAEYSADAARKDAILHLRSNWAHLPEEQQFEREFNLFVQNGLKHDLWVPKMKQAVAGFLNTYVQNQGKEFSPDQLALIQEQAQLYAKIKYERGNGAYWDKHLDKKTRDFFELYHTATRYGGMDPKTAAATVAQIYGNQGDLSYDRVDRAKIKDLVLSSGRTWSEYLFEDNSPEGATVNVGEQPGLMHQIGALADLYKRLGNLSDEEAIEAAVENVKKSSVNVNGQLIFGEPGLQKGDAKHFNAYFENNLFPRFGDQLANQGIESKDDLRLQQGPGGIFFLTNKATGMPVMVYPPNRDMNPNQENRNAPEPVAIRIPTKMIMGLRQKDLQYKHKEALDEATKIFSGKTHNPYAPHNILRGVFGQSPTEPPREEAK